MAVTKSNKVVGAGASKGAAAKGNNFFIDFSGPASDGVLDADAFEKFLHDRIKVDGKAGQLGDVVQITREGEGKIWVKTTIPFSKRYLKYLTKKFLKRAELRDWLRVVATSKPGFEIKYVLLYTSVLLTLQVLQRLVRPGGGGGRRGVNTSPTPPFFLQNLLFLSCAWIFSLTCFRAC